MCKHIDIIDVQSHFLPEKWLKAVSYRKEYPLFQELDNDKIMLHGSEHDKLPYHKKKSAIDINAKIKEMDDAGIFLTLLSLSPPGPECSFNEDSDELASIANDGIAEIITAFPDRFSGIASLGFFDMNKSILELSRCFDEMNFAGLQIFPYARGKGIEGKEFYPIYEILEQRQKPLILHPGSPVNKDYNNYNVGALMGYWFDDAICVVKLILSGMLDRFPNLRILCPHVWALLPYLIERIDIQTSRFPEFFSAKLEKTPGEYLSKIYTDCNNFSSDNIVFSIKKMDGIDRMMFGSDSPFVNAKFMVETLMKTGLTENDLNKILFENAVAFFNLSL